MERQCRDTFFCGEMIPPYEPQDVRNILKYYAQYEAAPAFYTFEEIDRSRLDVAAIARKIWDERMTAQEETAYLNALWDSGDDNMLKLFFGRKLYFLKQLQIERMKLMYPDIYEEQGNNVEFGRRKLEDLPLYEIGKINPELEQKLRDEAFEKSKNEKGEYQCACCGRTGTSRVAFQVDHIVPMNAGGKTVPENLQILCRQCNGEKSDRI